jgi:inner membrane protein
MYFFSGKFWRTYAVALIAMATHPVLDFLNPYGLRPFLPWSGKWYYGDIMFIFDPYVDAALLAGILWGSWRPTHRRLAAVLSLSLAVLYVGGRIELHSLAASNAEAFIQQSRDTKKSAALPEMLNPLLWEVINQTDDGFVRFPVYARRRPATPIDELTQMRNSPSSEIITKAATSRSATVLMRFARFPIVDVDQLPSGYRVTFFDFRFYREATGTALGSVVRLDPSLRIEGENLSFVERID